MEGGNGFHARGGTRLCDDDVRRALSRAIFDEDVRESLRLRWRQAGGRRERQARPWQDGARDQGRISVRPDLGPTQEIPVPRTPRTRRTFGNPHSLRQRDRGRPQHRRLRSHRLLPQRPRSETFQGQQCPDARRFGSYGRTAVYSVQEPGRLSSGSCCHERGRDRARAHRVDRRSQAPGSRPSQADACDRRLPQKPRRTTMIPRLLPEERGMALGLAIIVVVIVGVMGAGLLTFVATDLEAVLAVNRGEQASNWPKQGSRSPKHTSRTTRARPTGPRENSTWPAWSRVPLPLVSHPTPKAGRSRQSPQATTGRRAVRSKLPSPSKKASQGS